MTATLPPTRPTADLDERPDRTDAQQIADRQGIKIPINLDNWKHLPKDVQDELTWWHQHCHDERLSQKEAAETIGYDWSTAYRILHGTYTGSWENILKAVRSYRRIATERAKIQHSQFSKNAITDLIWNGLDYALTNNSITTIVGESRMGKTLSALAWRDRNNHGRAVYVIAPAYGGTKALLVDIANAVGVGRTGNVYQIHQAILKAFNKNRILIVDEAHRLLPNDRSSNPVNLEIIRDIRDRTGAAVALLATARFDSTLRKSDYMFEQLLGRIGMPVRLPRKLREIDIEPIVRQYLPRPSVKVLETALEVSNAIGRLGILVETLKVAHRMATKAGEKPREEHFFKALAVRKQMMGETLYAAK